MCRSILMAVIFGCGMLPHAAQLTGGEPFVPASDAEVIDSLPRALIDGQREVTALRSALRDSPHSVAAAVRLVTKYIEMGDAEADPRYFGYAQSALRPWWESSDAPPEVLRLRAKLKEKEHRYSDALVDLRCLTDLAPNDAQAWIELSNVCRVQGEYDEALRACDRLATFAGEVPVMIARAPVYAVTGRAEEASEMLSRIPASAKSRLGAAYQWVLGMRAELARILGRDDEAERHFLDAMQNNPHHNHTLRAFTDFLLDRDRPQKVLELVRAGSNDNGLLLRAAIAARRVGDDERADAWQRQLAIRFEEIRLRGGQPHGRFESRFALELERDPEKALALAVSNWELQKEARDARNVLESALAAGEHKAAAPVVRFLKSHRTEDPSLRALISRLEPKE